MASSALERDQGLLPSVGRRGGQGLTLVSQSDVDDGQHPRGPRGQRLRGGRERSGERIGGAAGPDVIE